LLLRDAVDAATASKDGARVNPNNLSAGIGTFE
jgi:hypothetical protein